MFVSHSVVVLIFVLFSALLINTEDILNFEGTHMLNVSSSAVVKTIKHTMKMALTSTTQGKEDREFPLLQRISSLVTRLRNHKLTAPKIRAHMHASHAS